MAKMAVTKRNNNVKLFHLVVILFAALATTITTIGANHNHHHHHNDNNEVVITPKMPRSAAATVSKPNKHIRSTYIEDSEENTEENAYNNMIYLPLDGELDNSGFGLGLGDNGGNGNDEEEIELNRKSDMEMDSATTTASMVATTPLFEDTLNNSTANTFNINYNDDGSSDELNATYQTLMDLFDNVKCGIKNGPNYGLIVGGSEAPPHAWPWAVGVLRYGSFICGGTILSEYYILTAAHCVSRHRQTQPPSSFQVLIGSHNIRNSGRLYPVERVIAHEYYDENFMQNDIALFRLRTPINFSSFGGKARPVCLPTPAMDSRSFTGRLATVVGWGYRREGAGQISNTLHQVQIPIISNQQCAQKYNSANIRAGQICAAYPTGGRDSCQGDSGGSLTVSDGGKFFQLGVVSWGSGCARPNSPGVYTRVSKYVNWIARNVR